MSRQKHQAAETRLGCNERSEGGGCHGCRTVPDVWRAAILLDRYRTAATTAPVPERHTTPTSANPASLNVAMCHSAEGRELLGRIVALEHRAPLPWLSGALAWVIVKVKPNSPKLLLLVTDD